MDETVGAGGPGYDFSDLSYLSASDELEATVRGLESAQLELEDSLELYERGIALIRELQQRLDQAQQKIDVLMGELEPESSDDVDNELS
ncbi:MAG: exodeoxyribonuclease VII small subunit [Coriobacteriia bacterium]|nr:exodeoxyribonuclease VII small subunit [Coriobacteriia bacterium]